MRVYTRAVSKWDEALQRYVTDVEASQFVDDYSGPVEQLKKGREQQQQITQQQMQLAQHNQQIQDENRAKSEPFVQSLERTKPGELSPEAQGQYESDLRNINDTYGDSMRTGLRMLAYRGLGSAPTGAEASIINTNHRGRDASETEAYNQALQNTYNQGLAALNYRNGQQVQYNALPAWSSASDSAYKQSQMGSTLGDIGAGISTLGSTAGRVMTGVGAMG